ncbi:hypothetical protein CUJ84_pRLN3000061 (plasmid) [Rhizobium leguminosarum]|uniref:Uncharacterized protein n=1 Tax=Rhizobium leguminosarum TaxID=384 RepID=A0A2K9ZG57_RHILE|nr:hypothetical protein CUJ84_pRLN3000061 [Rhizobium leguminosarum]
MNSRSTMAFTTSWTISSRRISFQTSNWLNYGGVRARPLMTVRTNSHEIEPQLRADCGRSPPNIK